MLNNATMNWKNYPYWSLIIAFKRRFNPQIRKRSRIQDPEFPESKKKWLTQNIWNHLHDAIENKSWVMMITNSRTQLNSWIENNEASCVNDRDHNGQSPGRGPGGRVGEICGAALLYVRGGVYDVVTQHRLDAAGRTGRLLAWSLYSSSFLPAMRTHPTPPSWWDLGMMQFSNMNHARSNNDTTRKTPTFRGRHK